MTDLKNNRVFLHGISMRPLMRNGDMPQMTEIERGSVVPGDVIVFRNAEGKHIIHRVIQTEPQLVTRGDNCSHDDPPVPSGSLVWAVSGFTRNGKFHPLKDGAAGVRQFRRHQLRRRILCRLRRAGGALLRLNFFRYPFTKLKAVQFQQKTIYYFGNRPVGYFENGRWHWLMRFARFWITDPSEK